MPFQVHPARLSNGGQPRPQIKRRAEARFESAYAKVPSPKLFFNFAQVHRRLGRTVEALDFYERYLAETPDAPAKLRTEAQQRTADLKKRVATIAIRSAAVGHEVTVDGRSLADGDRGSIHYGRSLGAVPLLRPGCRGCR